MADLHYEPAVLKSAYEKQTEKHIQELNKIIIAFRTRVSVLEKELAEKERMPIPQSIVKQIAELELQNRKLTEQIKENEELELQNIKLVEQIKKYEEAASKPVAVIEEPPPKETRKRGLVTAQKKIKEPLPIVVDEQQEVIEEPKTEPKKVFNSFPLVVNWIKKKIVKNENDTMIQQKQQVEEKPDVNEMKIINNEKKITSTRRGGLR